MSFIHPLLQAAGLAILCLATLYGLLTVAAVLWWRRRPLVPGAAPVRAVSLLKPLCGAEPGLYGQLRSFCDQDHPAYEVVFGVRDPTDPACEVVGRLVAEFPGVAIRLVCDPQQHGANPKVSNLANMLRHARHAVLVISDSDARVGRDYLACVTAPLRTPGVGLVTSLYRAIPTPDLWSRLAAMYINEWYMPSVLLARMFGHRDYVSGQTIALRRDTLEKIGGLAALADYLAEDHRLGELVRDQGLGIVITPYPVICMQHEDSLRSLSDHELRWLRTVRTLKPASFRWLFTTFTLPLGLAGWLLTRAGPMDIAALAADGALALTLAVRFALYSLHRHGDARGRLADLWLVPLRDLLLVWEWVKAFASGHVVWRGREFLVAPGGLMRLVPGGEQSGPQGTGQLSH